MDLVSREPFMNALKGTTRILARSTLCFDLAGKRPANFPLLRACGSTHQAHLSSIIHGWSSS